MYLLDDLDQIPSLPRSWFDADLSEEERLIQETAHRFAETVMRPNCEKMDKMTPEEVTANGSLWYDTLSAYKELGFDYKTFDGMSHDQATRMQALAIEELGWGDMGFAVGMMVYDFPSAISHLLGKDELAERYADKIGCWIATQPDRGSDVVDFQGEEIAKGSRQNRANLIARWEDDHLVVNGQSSAWVSLAPLAEVGVLMIQCDWGDGLHRANGSLNGVVALCPLDLDGVSKGRPLDKLGQRSLPQGEIFFDDVVVPGDHVVLGQDGFDRGSFTLLSEGNTVHSAAVTGVARAAFEHALAYAHERRQGGARLIDHQLVRHRIFKMFQQVEAMRALSRRAYSYLGNATNPEIAVAIAAKVYCTEVAFQITSDALQMFGGNGLTKEYPLEKLMRDARATMIEDGESHILGLVAANRISRIYEERMT